MVAQSRAAFNGNEVIALPAGLIGDIDPAETAKTAGPKEVLEETGYVANKSGSLIENRFATSAGMTDELKRFC